MALENLPRKRNSKIFKNEQMKRPRRINSLRHDYVDRFLVSELVILLEGPSGSGKTYLAKAIAKKRNLPLHIIQINDQIDSKTLCGQFESSEFPGKFVWKPSKFADVVQKPCVVVFENIDHGTSDLVAEILSFAKSRNSKVKMSPECRIILTISTNFSTANKGISNTSFLKNFPFTFKLQPLDDSDLRKLISMNFPSLISIGEKLVLIFRRILNYSGSLQFSERRINSSDFFRVCRQLSTMDMVYNNIGFFKMLLVYWTMHFSKLEHVKHASHLIAGDLSLSEEQADFLVERNCPDISFNENFITLGSVQISRQQKIKLELPNFAFCRNYCQIIEGIALVLGLSRETKRMSIDPVLLTGETGVGKTSVVQLIAALLNKPLKVINMNQESEFSDLMGGFKPSSFSALLLTLKNWYIEVFTSTYSKSKNMKFLENIKKCIDMNKHVKLLTLIIKSSLMSYKKYPYDERWSKLVQKARAYLEFVNTRRNTCQTLFAYIRGMLAEAALKGYWLLIDEINLAPPECLDALFDVLDSGSYHHDFRLFACMNPVGDVDKRILPPVVRSRFVEFFVREPCTDDQITLIVRKYRPSLDDKRVQAIVGFYQQTRRQFPTRYSLRTLCRALSTSITEGNIPLGFYIAFSDHLKLAERKCMKKSIEHSFGTFSIQHKVKVDSAKYISIEEILLRRGSLEPKLDNKFILTESVKENLIFLSRVVATNRFPILLEGETSAGKTSMITYLANATGNVVHRINNHENTDVQEYIGGYAPNAEGSMEFVEGVLLKAVKNGHWVILDELNLASGAVLEALNRLLDDNRELFVPELNCAIKPHPQFQLFATQNPVGTYAGRKLLSKAFLNRFLVLYFEPPPFEELRQIVCDRCAIPNSRADLMVQVLIELKSRRAMSKIFSSSDGLMTLRDLFRWGNRIAATCHDVQTLIDQGYFVLGSRCRDEADERAVIDVLQGVTKRTINKEELFGLNSVYLPNLPNQLDHIVFTRQMRRMLILCAEAWKREEPVLFIGETGCGKTTAAHLFGPLLSINCHERMDASDFLGSIRPIVSNNASGFQWNDGVVIKAMRSGTPLLIDEISLASDSVIERLNPVFEPSRSILLVDTGSDQSVIKAESGFQMVATMNPGNDHGKKELSRALRNRFTEIWCPSEHTRDELINIVERRITYSHLNSQSHKIIEPNVSAFFVDFFYYFNEKASDKLRYILSLRDLTVTAEMFVHFFFEHHFSLVESLFHSLDANIFDSIGVLPARISFDKAAFIDELMEKFHQLLQKWEIVSIEDFVSTNSLKHSIHRLTILNDALTFGPFSLPFLNALPETADHFSFDAPTTRRNLFRVLRALNSSKPIMLEGSPGAGKSSLINKLATITGRKLVQLNLSEQTDVYDLFGNDVPVVMSDGSTTFSWMDGPILKAIKEGSWILLDEMNLASQSVLEGLNSCFDFRKNLFISELDKTFEIDTTSCRFFACQNPHAQGGGRKQLPKSFLNRFLSIFVDEMRDEDFVFILCERYVKKESKGFDEELIAKIVLVNKLCRERLQNTQLGIVSGGPFEFNLRDLNRWMSAIVQFGSTSFGFDLVYLSRLRSANVREQLISDVYNRVFQEPWSLSIPIITAFEHNYKIGNVSLNVGANELCETNQNNSETFLLGTQSSLLEKLAACAAANWIALVVSPANTGKRSTIKSLARLANRPLQRMKLSAETDVLDLLGSFEQAITGVDESEVVTFDDVNMELTEGSLKSNTHFVWVNSKLVDAYKNGEWILIEDVNCCSSAALDCLNSCLEGSGSDEIFIPFTNDATNSENSTLGYKVKRHPNFRVFFTMDPSNGPISRAMRNRSVEIFYAHHETSAALQGDDSVLPSEEWTHNFTDAISVILPHREMGVKEGEQKGLYKLIEDAREAFNSKEHTACQLLRFKALLSSVHHQQRGIDMNSAKFEATATRYGHELTLFFNTLTQFCVKASITSSSQQTFIFRPAFSSSIYEFSTALSKYYWRCWNSVSLKFDNVVSFVLALLFPRVFIRMRKGEELFGFQNIETSIKQQICSAFNEGHDLCSFDFNDHVFNQEIIVENCYPGLNAARSNWRALRQTASNETSEGCSYVDKISHYALCYPHSVADNVHFDAFLNSLSSVLPLSAPTKNSSEDDSFFKAESILHSFLDLIRKATLQSTTLRLPWKDLTAGEAFSKLLFLANPFQQLNLDKSIDNFAVLSLLFITMSFCQLWQSIGHDFFFHDKSYK